MTVALNSIFELKKGKTKDDIPESPNPFFVLSKEGLFLKKSTMLGISLVKQDAMPKSLGELGFPRGYFTYDAPLIPAEICAQIVDFFRRIWDKHRAEAEVILTARIEMVDGFPKILEWRVFIPTQKVSGGGVEIAYEPRHIAKGYQVIGTMHSHCNFTAYHSGTDTGDAKGFDGVHFTIGHVDKDKPQVVCMVSMGGVNVDFDPEVAGVFNQLDTATAPPWWDNYVLPTKDLATAHKVAGFGNFEKYERKPQYQATSYTPAPNPYGHWEGNRFIRNDNPIKDFNKPDVNAARIINPATVGTKTLKQLQEEQEAKRTGHISDETYKDKNLLPADTRSLIVPLQTEVDRDLLTDEDIMRLAGELYWEDNLDKTLRNLLFDFNLLTDDDIDMLAATQGSGVDTFLRRLMLVKLKALKNVLTILGVELDIGMVRMEPIKRMKKKKRSQILNGRNRRN